MTHRERVRAAVRGEPTDRIPADYYGTPEATKKYVEELHLKDEKDLIAFLDVDVVRAYPGPGKVNVSREKEFLKHVDSPSEVRRILEDIPPLDDLVDNTPIVQTRKTYPDHAIMIYGPGSIFLSVNSFFGYETALMHHAARPDIIEELVKCSVEYALKEIDKLHRDIGNAADIVSLEDDYGTQNSLYISRDMFVRFYKPAFTKVIAHLKQYGYLVQFHSCGAVSQIIPDFIEMGVDVLDPVQVRATGMEIESLAAKFKGRICFHGGLDTQNLLPYGTPEEVAREVERIISLFGTTGAFIAPSQFFLPDIPTANLLAMYRAKRTP